MLPNVAKIVLLGFFAALLIFDGSNAQYYGPSGTYGSNAIGERWAGGAYNPANRMEAGAVQGAVQGAQTLGVPGAIAGATLGSAGGLIGRKRRSVDYLAEMLKK
ncbi:hypothetical protein Ddc_10495 [Ditylenchus destructor]|nr:hypothetical protein Ddc_10495 [Ditylenchus destructor]